MKPEGRIERALAEFERVAQLQDIPSSLPGLARSALKELTERIEQLEQRNSKLEGDIDVSIQTAKLLSCQRDNADVAIGLLRAHIETLERSLREIHEERCGCDQPGRSDLCVAQPVACFRVLDQQRGDSL